MNNSLLYLLIAEGFVGISIIIMVLWLMSRRDKKRDAEWSSVRKIAEKSHFVTMDNNEQLRQIRADTSKMAGNHPQQTDQNSAAA